MPPPTRTPHQTRYFLVEAPTTAPITPRVLAGVTLWLYGWLTNLQVGSLGPLPRGCALAGTALSEWVQSRCSGVGGVQVRAAVRGGMAAPGTPSLRLCPPPLALRSTG